MTSRHDAGSGGSMSRLERDTYGAFLERIGRGDLPAAGVRDLIVDAAARLGLDDIDPLAVAGGGVDGRVAAAIAAALDAPPPCAPMMMPTQDLGFDPPLFARLRPTRRRAEHGAAAK